MTSPVHLLTVNLAYEASKEGKHAQDVLDVLR